MERLHKIFIYSWFSLERICERRSFSSWVPLNIFNCSQCTNQLFNHWRMQRINWNDDCKKIIIGRTQITIIGSPSRVVEWCVVFESFITDYINLVDRILVNNRASLLYPDQSIFRCIFSQVFKFSTQFSANLYYLYSLNSSRSTLRSISLSQFSVIVIIIGS